MLSGSTARRVIALCCALAIAGGSVPYAGGAQPRSRAATSGGASPPRSPSSSPPERTTVPETPLPSYVRTVRCVSAANTGTPVRNGVSWAQQQLGYPALWQLTGRGTGQTVAVIDTGVSPVAAFGARLHGLADFVRPDDEGLQDCDGHGTAVAGLIAAAPDPVSGFAGVAPGAAIVSIRQSSRDYGRKNAQPGSAGQTAGTTTTLAQAIIVAADSGADVINISETSCSTPQQSTADPGTRDIRRAVRHALSRNVVVVAAAGNISADSGTCARQNVEGETPVTLATPANVPGVLAVGAVDQEGRPASFSLAGPWVGVAAPGVDIISSNPAPGTIGQVNTFRTSAGVAPIQGTSFAAPYVSGLVALVRERFPTLDATQVVRRIELTAQHPPAAGLRDDSVGFGMIDPSAALTAVLPGETAPAQQRNSGPLVLPIARPHVDGERSARHVALLGVLAVLVLIAVGVLAGSARRRRSLPPVDRASLRAGSGRRRRGQ